MPKATSTALAKREPTEIDFTQDRIDLLKKTLMPHGSTDDELALFVEICKRRKLDPFARQIYAIRRKQRVNGNWVEVTKAETSIDGFRAIAERNPAYAGQLGPWWCGKDGTWKEIWTDDLPPYAAKIGVVRSDFKEPLYSIAKFDAYKATFQDGKLMGLWSKMPDNQIAKCAEALALRRAFPEDLSGLYTSDEMQQADPPAQPPMELGEPLPPKHVIPEPVKPPERERKTRSCPECLDENADPVYFTPCPVHHPEDDPTPPRPSETKTKNFKFMEAMGKQKARVGKTAYYKILGGAGYEHCSEIADRNSQKLAFKLLSELPDAVAVEREAGDEPW